MAAQTLNPAVEPPGTAKRLPSAKFTQTDREQDVDARGSWAPSFSFAFKVLCAARLAAAIFSNISDCDEVFNFWEPTHYLHYGRGMQTWEYAPVYAIRSWMYIWLHSIVGRFMELLVSRDKITVFYETRGALGIASAFCEARLYDAVAKNVSPVIGRYFLLLLMVNTGMFISSTGNTMARASFCIGFSAEAPVVAFLPSTFAMYAVTLAASYSFDPPGRRRTYAVVSLIGVGSLLGWPFAAAAGLPFVMEELSLSGPPLIRLQHMVEAGVLTVAGILGPMLAIDSLLYNRLALVPFNIVHYNIFAGKDRGPNIYGTEPWWFYILNGLLNFNIAFPVALLALPALLLNAAWSYFKRHTSHFPTEGGRALRLAAKLAPAHLWLGIFTLQPHKEERFLFVVYPLLCLNAAVMLFVARSWITRAVSRITLPSTASRTSELLVNTFLTAFAVLSLSRSMALYSHYHAPIDVFHYTMTLPAPASSDTGERVLCIGKEWYRFPGHYFVPDDMRVEFLKSEFTGLLPGHFKEPIEEKPGERRFGERFAHVVPSSMNDKNQEAMDKYVPLGVCDYVADYTPPGSLKYDEGAVQPLYALDTRTWRKHRCERFLDAAGSGRLQRAFWLPYTGARKQWGEWCLLTRVAE
ncbi:Alg9-like mannosyltransferase family-domain-containing protein [Geranomyces variabilis]|nr:Alg9-like mannosyltransferase family-domain-containing protein [Geranomyces variabilis]KAJ3136451.1 mannosyltransferase [Geranomyces variabilis]